ncbi:hypothetical protein POM88_016401 [Heracleum sosnowskyi]|uniref:Pectin acetylesterase n=1 Tax=Heracleum sosnowskyi TaxID=360622 RepID=A0AAD8M0F2_9APIA|nr:hypothetical protein POM88_049282 [Heracleum sosnowskyi]KAK1388223.1 hypothetical protein POM88_016401 [Heracleum sosnowskyi]
MPVNLWTGAEITTCYFAESGGLQGEDYFSKEILCATKHWCYTALGLMSHTRRTTYKPSFLVDAVEKYNIYLTLFTGQFHHILLPTSADPHGVWNHCKQNPTSCSPNQIDVLQEAVGDWYFGRRATKEINCAYPCDDTCHNLIGLCSSFEHYNGIHART